MKTSSWLLLSLTTAGFAFAQNAPLSGISESTDPAKIAEIEQRAQEIAAKPQATEEVAPRPNMPAKRHRMHKAKPAKPAMEAPKPEAAPG